MPEQKPYRLPSTATPDRYEIRLTPDLDAATFLGEETIYVQIHEPVRQMVVNAAELNLQTVTAQNVAGANLAGVVALDDENEQATSSG